MSQAFLRGREHERIGAIELIGEGSCAVAISRGGAAKTYTYTDPNEDVCVFHRGAGGVVLAVADGHGGASGSEVALERIFERHAERWTSRSTPASEAIAAELHEALLEAAAAVEAQGANAGLPPAPTTLSLALLRPGDDLLAHMSIGDSHIFCARDSGVEDLGWAATAEQNAHYLGDPRHHPLSPRHRIETAPLGDTRALVLVTDGFSERRIGVDEPTEAMQRIVDRELASDRRLSPGRLPVEICRTTVRTAIRAHRENRAGDNIACAVWVRESDVGE